jgi:cobalt-zinc-cadmium efflux system protein
LVEPSEQEITLAHDDHSEDHPDHEHHAHSHGAGGHTHAPKSFGAAFAIGISLNIAFVIVEAIFGIVAKSLALVADAGHNFSDVLGLALAWGAASLANVGPKPGRSYGYRRSSILAALGNAVLLLIAIGAIAWEAIKRFWEPEPVAGWTMIWVSLVAIVINGATALLFMSGRKGDINLQAAFLHMMSDAATAAGVVIAGVLILATGWHWVDPLISLIIVVIIFFGTWGLLRDSFNLSLDAVPPGIDETGIRKYLASLNRVTEVHDLHIWAMSTTETALTVHIVAPQVSGSAFPDDDALLNEVCEELKHRFRIDHATIQIERGTQVCRLAGDDTL